MFNERRVIGELAYFRPFVFEKITHFLCITSNKIDRFSQFRQVSKISSDCISCFLKSNPVFLKGD